MIDGAAANQALGALADSVTQAASAQDVAQAPTIPTQTMLVLRAGSRWLALPAEAVREVVLKSFTTRIPLAPPQVLGVTLIRGRLLPVVSLDVLLPASATDVIAQTLPRLVLIETVEAGVAIVADEVHGVVEFSAESLSDQATAGARPSWITAEVTWEKRVLCILHPQRLIAASLGEEEQR